MSRILYGGLIACVIGQTALAATVEGGGTGKPADTLIAKAQAVCDGAFVLTSDAMNACTSKAWPAVLTDGTRFRNTGIGAEFNTLIRQLPKAEAAAKPANG